MPQEEKSPLDSESTPQHIATFKKSILPRLNELGVTKLTVNYSGSGDEGSIEGFDVEPQGLVVPKELEEQICDLADQFLYSEQIGRASWRVRV